MRRVIAITTTALVAATAASAGPQSRRADGALRGTQGAEPTASADQRLREARYQLGQMEGLLEGAVEHGASVIRDRLQAVMPADMLLTEDAHARGFRLEGYGVFFDVEVPSLSGTLAWSFRTLDQNALGLDAALQTLRAHVQAGHDVNLQQALKRIELQVAPLAAATPETAATAVATGGVVQSGPASAPRAAVDPILQNPDEAYRTEIRDALMDAMLEHSRGLAIGPDEWLTVAARRSDDRPRLGIDTDARTMVLSVKGSDLAAFLRGQLTPLDARGRIQVRVF